jgi:hypothetical protein
MVGMKPAPSLYRWFVLCALAAAPGPGAFCAAPPKPPPVVLRISTLLSTRAVSLEDLEKKLVPATVKVFNPSYQQKMAYRGFWLEDVLRTFEFPKSSQAQIVFICRDGYTEVLSNGWVGRHKWLLAYEETSGSWTPLVQGRQAISPAPWYLVGSKQSSFGDFPWPYAVVGIKSLNNW